MSAFAALRTRVETAEGSTRPIGLVRIGLALIVWARFANDFALWHDRTWLWGVLGGSIYLSSTLLLVGWRSRLAALWTAVTILLMVVLLGVRQKHYELVHHHISLLMITVGLLALTPCGASFSVDRWLALRRARRSGRGNAAAPPERGPLWGTWLIGLQTSAVYLWGAIDKTHAGWLQGDRMEHIWMYFYFGSDTPESPLFGAAALAVGAGTVIFEYAVAIGLWLRRWQLGFMAAGVVFHAVIYFTTPVATFSVTMFVLYLVYLPTERVHEIIDDLLGHVASPVGSGQDASP